MKALSLYPFWCPAIVGGDWRTGRLASDADKDIENRVRWSGSSFRGELLIHAGKAVDPREYAGCVAFAEARGLRWRPDPIEQVVTGGIVGLARVVDVIMPNGKIHAGPGHRPSDAWDVAHPKAKSRWYMGHFALVLEDRVPLPFMPWRGAQGLFAVDRAQLLEAMPKTVPRSIQQRILAAA